VQEAQKHSRKKRKKKHTIGAVYMWNTLGHQQNHPMLPTKKPQCAKRGLTKAKNMMLGYT